MPAPVDPTTWLTNIFNNILNRFIWPLFSILAVIMFIWAGILYLTANGDSSKIQAANKAVIFGVIGIIVAILSFSVTGIIRGIIDPGTTPIGGSCTTNADCGPAAPNCVSGICQL